MSKSITINGVKVTSKEKQAHKLIQSLRKAQEEKDAAAGRKIRKQLRRLGFFKEQREELEAKLSKKSKKSPKSQTEEAPVEEPVEAEAVEEVTA